MPLTFAEVNELALRRHNEAATLRDEFEGLQAKARLSGNQLRREEQRCRELQKEVDANAGALREIEVGEEQRRNELQQHLSEIDCDLKALRGEMAAERARAEDLREERQYREREARELIRSEKKSLNAILDRCNQVESGRTPRGHSEAEAIAEARAARVTEHKGRRKEQCWQLRRQLVEVQRATRRAEEAGPCIGEEALRARLEACRESQARAYRGNREATEELAEAQLQEAGLAAQLEVAAKSWSLLVPEEAKLREEVDERVAAALSASERAVHAEADAVRRDMAREARWLRRAADVASGKQTFGSLVRGV